MSKRVNDDVLRVLDEEKSEADDHAAGALFGACACFLAAIVNAGMWTNKGARWAVFACIGFMFATLFCLAWYWRARHVIRRWRQQERDCIALAEAERIGKEVGK